MPKVQNKFAVVTVCGVNRRGVSAEVLDYLAGRGDLAPISHRNSSSDQAGDGPKIPFTIRCACVRAMGPVGFLQLFVEGSPSSISRLCSSEEQAALAASLSKKPMGIAGAPVDCRGLEEIHVRIEPSRAPRFDTVRRDRLLHRYVVFNAARYGPVFYARTLGELGWEIAQHDEITRRIVPGGAEVHLEQAFRIYIRRDRLPEGKSEDEVVRESILGKVLPTLDAAKQGDFRKSFSVAVPPFGRGLPEGTGPLEAADRSTRDYTYLFLVCRDRLGLLSASADFVSTCGAAIDLSRGSTQPIPPQKIVRSCCRAMSGLAVNILAVERNGIEPSGIGVHMSRDRFVLTVNRAIRNFPNNIDGVPQEPFRADDIVMFATLVSPTSPWEYRRELACATIRVSCDRDVPGLLHALCVRLRDVGAEADLDIVELDGWVPHKDDVDGDHALGIVISVLYKRHQGLSRDELRRRLLPLANEHGVELEIL